MKIPPVKGTRDFYPEEMALHNWIVDGWKKASIRNGFEEYDGPIFEYLQMYQVKSGDEIVEQLFSFKDRGERDLAIRPEITPTLARMVNQKINALPKPIKWFSVPRLCRAERPQKGRLREFFQWNIDIIGVDDVLADAEVIFTTVDYLRSIGLTHRDVQVKISSRKLLAEGLRNIGVPEDKLNSLYILLDKHAKLSPETFKEELSKQTGDTSIVDKLIMLMRSTTILEACNILGLNPNADPAAQELAHLDDILQTMGVGQYCTLCPSIVRGLAYYTGIVFEVHELLGSLRAICGGGRFDNLLHDFGGPSIPATGMGMGDCVLEILLRERGLIPEAIMGRKLDYFVALADKTLTKEVYTVVAKLRSKGYSANFSYKPLSGLSKQLKEASEQNAKKCIIIGDEFKTGDIVIKDMATGQQQTVNFEEFLASPKSSSQ